MFDRLDAYRSYVPLLLRLGVGLTFFFAGLGKVMGGTAGVAGFFGSLGIPAPAMMGPFIAYLELLGGLALILGLFTRAFSLLFIANMLVALVLVNLPAAGAAATVAEGFTSVRTELLLLLGSLCLVLLGSGLVSLDALLFKNQQSSNVEQARV